MLLLVLPLLMAATFMWSMWDPSKSLPNVPLAVVNHDAGTEANGEQMDIGGQVVDGLLSTDYLKFEEVRPSRPRSA